jgi:ATP-dependent DNA helicase RecQ
VIDQLLFDGLLGEDDQDNRPVLYAADKETTRSVFAGDITVTLREDPTEARARRGAKKAARGDAAAALSERDRALFDALRTWRATTARANAVPPYVIFHDRTLHEIAQQRPINVAELRQIGGVGERKAERYGAEISKIVQEAA